jgi:hypothetical protein
MSNEEREQRAEAAGRLLVLLAEAREALDTAGLEGEQGGDDAVRALRDALLWASRVALRRELAALDPGAGPSLLNTLH